MKYFTEYTNQIKNIHKKLIFALVHKKYLSIIQKGWIIFFLLLLLPRRNHVFFSFVNFLRKFKN